MYQHRAQVNRFELKYIVNEAQIPGIREFIRDYLQLDEYARPELANNYQIHSLYLDSPDLALCTATMHGHKNRFKLRIRFYDEEPEHPVFFEVKQRLNDIIHKERGGRAPLRRVAAREFWLAAAERSHGVFGKVVGGARAVLSPARCATGRRTIVCLLSA